MTTPVRPPRPALRATAAGLLLAGALAGCGTAPPPPSTPSPAAAGGPAPAARVLHATVAHGSVTGDTGRIAVPRGTPVELDVASDAADEVHVHGYNQEAEIPAGGTASVRFVADIPGVFETELHGIKKQVLQLEVS